MRRLKCILLSCLIALSVFTVASAQEGYSSDIDISEFLFDDTVEDISLATPKFSDMQTVAENENLKLYFYPEGLDIYVVSDTGKVWSNVICEEYYRQQSPTPSVSSQLLSVSACDDEGNVKEYVLYDGGNSDITADCKIENEQLLMDINIEEIKLSFKLIFGIDGDGFYYHVPDKEINEAGGKLISLSILQNFGASRNDENGYIFYPDGSGSLVRFGKSNNAGSALNQLSVYGNSDVTYAQLERNRDDNIYGALLPVYGVAQTKDGFLAVIADGSADAKINLAMPGYQIPDLYRAYITYNYRSYSTTEFNKASISSLVDERTKVDRKCYFYLLSADKNNYSGMANRYRKHLTDNGILVDKNPEGDIPLSLNLLCGVQKNGIFRTTLQKMTTFEQAKKIAEWFTDNGVKNTDITLSGWSKGGWDTLPTAVKADGALGGSSGLKSLQKYCENNNINLSLEVDAILADSNTGSFNARNNAVRNYFGDFFVNKTGEKYILNAVRVMDNVYTKFSKNYPKAGLSLLTVGELALPDYNNKDVCTTQEIIDAYVSVMKRAKKDNIVLSADTGNAYILPYADFIHSLPQTDSGYTFSSESVPFYQMVIHGYIPYTGTVGNTHYDYDRCILEWIETGSIPSFILTYEETGKLLETGYDKVFTSEFSVWNEKIADTYKKYNADFADFSDETIVSHEKLREGVVKVVYSNGKSVYVNYNEQSFESGKIKVEGKAYLIVGE